MGVCTKTAQLSVGMPYADTFNAVSFALQGIPDLKYTGGNINTGTIVMRKGMSLFSYGSNIRVKISGHGPMETHIIIQSEPSWPLTLVDWGENKKIVNEIKLAICDTLGIPM